MASRTQQLVQLTGFGLYGETAYGRMNGIFFNASINNQNGNCTIRAYVRRVNGVDTAGAEMFLAENRKKYKNAKASYDGKSLNVVIANYLKLNVQTVAEFLSDFSQFLKNAGYSSACAFCEKTEGLGYTAQEDRVMETCPECHEKLAGIFSEMKQERAQTGSYLRGVAGAVLGGVIGIIPWVVLGMINFIAAISGAIMAYLSYKLYILFKGKRDKGMLYIIVVVLIVFTYLAVIVNQTITDYNLMSSFERGIITPFELFTYEIFGPFDPVNFDIGVYWLQLGLGWLFAGIGSYTYLKNIRKESTGKDLEVKRLS